MQMRSVLTSGVAVLVLAACSDGIVTTDRAPAPGETTVASQITANHWFWSEASVLTPPANGWSARYQLSGHSVHEFGSEWAHVEAWVRWAVVNSCADPMPWNPNVIYIYENPVFGAASLSHVIEPQFGVTIRASIETEHKFWLGAAYGPDLRGPVHSAAEVCMDTPPPPLSVSVSGPGYVSSPGMHTFTANPSGGTGVYTYQWWVAQGGWSFVPMGTAKTQDVNFTEGGGDVHLYVTVSSGGQNASSAVHYVQNAVGCGGSIPC